MWRNFQFPTIVIHGKLKFLHMTIFSPLIILVILVTNIRSAPNLLHVFPSEIAGFHNFWSASATWSASEFESKLKVLLGGYLTIVLLVHHGTMEDTQTKCQGCRPLLVAAHRTIWKLLPLHPLPTSPLQLTQNAGSWHCTHIWLLHLCQFLFRPRRTIFTFGDSFV